MFDRNTTNARKIPPETIRDSKDVAARCQAHLTEGGLNLPFGAKILSPSSSIAAATASYGEASMLFEHLLDEYQIPRGELADGYPTDPITGEYHPLAELWTSMKDMDGALRYEQKKHMH